jgi:hypothetical protein
VPAELHANRMQWLIRLSVRRGYVSYVEAWCALISLVTLSSTGTPGLHVHHVTRHNTPIHNILSTAPQLSISQKALGKLPEDGNVMSKHVGATVRN